MNPAIPSDSSWPWLANDAFADIMPQARGFPALAALAPSHQNTLVGSSQNDRAPPFGQPPPVTAAPSRKRKAPTLRDADWEPKKARITQLYIDEQLTIPRLRDSLVGEFGFQATERQILSRIQKWGLDKNVKKAESLFMSRKLKHRRMREPEKPGYVFTVRGKVQPPEKCERWEKRMDANNVAFSPCSVPETPDGLSYKTPQDSGSVNSAATPDSIARGISIPIQSPILMPSSPLAPTLTFVAVTQLEGGNRPSSPFPTHSPFISTPRIQAAIAFQAASSAASPAASTPGLIADSGFEGASPAPWNDVVHDALCAITSQSSTAESPSDTGFVYLQKEARDLEREISTLEQRFGKNNPQALKKMARLCNIFRRQGRYKSAEILAKQRLLAHRERGESKELSATLVDIAEIFLEQGELDRAERAATKAYNMSQTADPRDDIIAFNSKDSLAAICNLNGQLEKSEEILIGLLALVDTVFCNKDDADFTRRHVMTELSSSVVGQGRLAQAEQWAAKAVECCSLGSTKSSDTCSNAHLGLADILIMQGRFDEALKMSLEATSTCRKRYGLENPRTFYWMRILGVIYTHQGQRKEAESCLQAAISVGRKLLGPRHVLVHSVLIDMIYLYVEQQLWDHADAVLDESGAFSGDGPKRSLFLQSAILQARGRHSQALEIGQGFAEELESLNSFWGPYANNVIIGILRDLERLEESEDLASRTIVSSTSLLGPNHPDTLRSVGNLARTKMAKGEAAVAIRMMEECVQSLTASVGSEHYLTLRSRETLDGWLKPEDQNFDMWSAPL